MGHTQAGRIERKGEAWQRLCGGLWVRRPRSGWQSLAAHSHAGAGRSIF